MSAIAPELPGARVLDLFAGSGALGLEALSRGAREATFVERAPAAVRVLRANIESLGAADRSVVAVADALGFVEGLERFAFDVALADPPYQRGFAEALVERFQETCFAHLLVVEHRRGEAVPMPGSARQRRYGDTLLTFIPAPE